MDGLNTKIKRPFLELSPREVDAVVDYIFQHVRTSPNGAGYKVWQKMFAYQNGEVERIKETATLPLFE